MSELAVFCGTAHSQLARDICRHLNMPLGEALVKKFSNENIFVKINENVRGKDVFVIQPFTTPVNDSILELWIMIDALKRASAQRITAVIPYYAYGRTDKKDQPRVPITARMIADCTTTVGANRVLTMDLHAGQIQGFFSIPVDELTAQNILAQYIRSRELDGYTVVATDTGFAKKARNFAELLDAPLAIVEKRRVGNDGRMESLGLIGEVAGRDALIVDDEIDTAGTLVQA
ncbi:MAG: ribose-phosphate diphosphokinase, partial [Ktedonobacterales bacterium]